jgi:hypothetical protein
VLHILTLHLGDKWIDIQKRELARFISEPYKVYARLGDGVYPKENWKYKYNNQKAKVENSKYNDGTISYDKHKHKFDGAISGAQHWTYSMGKLLDYVLENHEVKPTDKIMLIDSDAFPIAPISDFLDEKLKEYPFVSAQEPMHEWDRNPLYLIPHPMFMLFEAKHIIEDNLTDYLRDVVKDKNNNWWGGTTDWLTERGYDYYPLTRSNKIDLHPLYYAIYDEVIYHHWAGSRNMITRPDRIRVGQIGPDIIPTEAQKKAVEDIAKENHEVSNQVFERIESEKDIDNMMAHLKGEYEES